VVSKRRAAIGLIVVIGILLVANFLFTAHEINASQHRWCATIDTLDNADQAAEHAPPAQKPKGAYSLALIRDFHQLRQSLGCG
jgi:hypothetical protein